MLPGFVSGIRVGGVRVLSLSGTPITTATEDIAYTGFTVTAVAGTLPCGISINSSSGAVSGTPPTPGSYPNLSAILPSWPGLGLQFFRRRLFVHHEAFAASNSTRQRSATRPSATLRPADRRRRMPRSTLQRAFETVGVEFTPENGGGAGVRLRKTAAPATQLPNGEAGIIDNSEM
jgi:hypothetical protein